MAKTVTALFENYTDANHAVHELVDHGFQRHDISIMAHESRTADDTRVQSDDTPGAVSGAGIGAALGGVGGLALSLSALAIPGIGPVMAAGPLVATLAGAGIGAAAGSLIGALTDLGVPEEEAHYYTEGIRRGGVLVTVQTSDALAEQAVSILSRHNPMDIDKHVEEWRRSGWSRFDTSSTPFLSPGPKDPRPGHTEEAYNLRGLAPEATTHQSQERRLAPEVTTHQSQERRPATVAHNAGHETVIPIVEEELNVTKRRTERDVNVRTTVIEQPVEEQVRLREEHVTVERRAVDRPVHAAEGEAFQETTMTVTETAEEPVITKQTRVVEEVVIHKNVEEHTETVRDTVRRTEVIVDQAGTTRQEVRPGFDIFDTDFRKHYTTTFAKGSDATYERYMPAYRYGYTMATEQRYADRDWTMIEPEARRTWEERHTGTWEQFKDAIHYAWDKVRGKSAVHRS